MQQLALMIRLCLGETAEFLGKVLPIDKNVIHIAKNVKFWVFKSLPPCTLPSAIYFNLGILQDSHCNCSDTGIDLFQKQIGVNVFNLTLIEVRTGKLFFLKGSRKRVNTVLDFLSLCELAGPCTP